MELFVVVGSIMVCKFLCWDVIGYLMFFFSLGSVFKLWESTLILSGEGFMMDLMNLLLLILSLWILGLMFMSSKKEEGSVMKDVYKYLLLLVFFCLFSSFMVVDLLMFYIFFELVLIPMFVFIVSFGYQPERLLSGVFMMLYTVFGSLPLFLGLMWLKSGGGSLNYVYLLNNKVEIKVWNLLLSMAFLIKLPIYGGHVWLPKAHVEAPLVGSMILAGLLLKLGGYGLVRMMFMLDLGYYEQSFFVLSGVWGGLVSGLICVRQLDLKKLVAYSSVVHMGLFLGGLSSFKFEGLYGSLMLMIGHGLCSSGLFYSVNVLYERFLSRSILLLKGVMSIFPSFMMWSFFLNLGNSGAPPFLNIFGEIMLGSGVLNWNSWMGILLMMMFFITVLYSIYLFSFLGHGKYMNSGGFVIKVNEYMVLSLHIIPLGMLVMKLESFSWI